MVCNLTTKNINNFKHLGKDTELLATQYLYPYLRIVFMVLDLRLVKIGCRETLNLFLYYIARNILRDRQGKSIEILLGDELCY